MAKPNCYWRPNIVDHLCFSKETLLLEPEKTAPRIETLEPEKVDEEEGEGKKDESSCSSEEEEEEDSESENEAGTCLKHWPPHTFLS